MKHLYPALEEYPRFGFRITRHGWGGLPYRTANPKHHRVFYLVCLGLACPRGSELSQKKRTKIRATSQLFMILVVSQR